MGDLFSHGRRLVASMMIKRSAVDGQDMSMTDCCPPDMDNEVCSCDDGGYQMAPKKHHH